MDDRWSYQLVFESDPDAAMDFFQELDTALVPLSKTLEVANRGARFHLNKWKRTNQRPEYVYEVTFEQPDADLAAEVAAEDLEEAIAIILASSRSPECQWTFALRDIPRVGWVAILMS